HRRVITRLLAGWEESGDYRFSASLSRSLHAFRWGACTPSDKPYCLGTFFTPTQHLVGDGETKLTHRRGEVKQKICIWTIAFRIGHARLGIAVRKRISLSI